MRTKICITIAVEALLFSALLFGGAGTIRWPAGWTFLILFFGGVIWLTIKLARHDLALLAERTVCVVKPTDSYPWAFIVGGA